MVSALPAAIALLRAELAARGDPEQTARFARAALTHISEQERGPHLWARWLLALADWLAGRAEQAEPALAVVLAEGRATAGSHPLVSSCITLARAQQARGRLTAALRTYREGLTVATEGDRPSTFHAAEAHVGLGQVLYERNQLDEALRHLTEGLALCRQLVAVQLSALAMVTMAWIRQASGDPDGARQTMDEACALLPDTLTATWYQPGAGGAGPPAPGPGPGGPGGPVGRGAGAAGGGRAVLSAGARPPAAGAAAVPARCC